MIYYLICLTLFLIFICLPDHYLPFAYIRLIRDYMRYLITKFILYYWLALLIAHCSFLHREDKFNKWLYIKCMFKALINTHKEMRYNLYNIYTCKLAFYDDNNISILNRKVINDIYSSLYGKDLITEMTTQLNILKRIRKHNKTCKLHNRYKLTKLTKTKEFCEWYYDPNNIGGIISKQRIYNAINY